MWQTKVSNKGFYNFSTKAKVFLLKRGRKTMFFRPVPSVVSFCVCITLASNQLFENCGTEDTFHKMQNTIKLKFHFSYRRFHILN